MEVLYNKLSFSKLILILFLVAFINLNAQDIEPRRWAPMPLGTQAIGMGYGYTSGKIYFDPLLQAENVTTDIHGIATVYIQPFRIGNKLARIDVLLPYANARWDGLLSGEPTTKTRSGFADPRIRFSVNLIGPSAMGPKEMMEYMKEHPVNTLFGASVAVTFPLGKYDETKLLNIGQNRFVIRPQIGMVHNWGLWSYELSGSLFIYTNNNKFYNDQVKKQDPVFAFQTHIIRRFNNRMWLSASAGYGLGGRSIVNSQPNDDLRGDFLWSLSYGLPITKTQAIKFVFLRSVTSKDVGADTNTLGMSWSKIL
jgi:hypothetical protein